MSSTTAVDALQTLRLVGSKDVGSFMKAVKTICSDLEKRVETERAEAIYLESQIPFETELLDQLTNEVNELGDGLNDNSHESLRGIEKHLDAIPSDLKARTHRVRVLLRALSAVRCIQHVQQIHHDLLGATNTTNWLNVINNVELLFELRHKLAASKCRSVYDYVNRICTLWRNELQSRLQTYVEFQLEQMSWPFDGRAAWPTQDSVPGNNLTHALEAWYVVWSLDDSTTVRATSADPDTSESETTVTKTATSDSDGIDEVPSAVTFAASQPPFIRCLFAPMEKRFIYHFYGARKTNANEKPEWFFTLVLEWCQWHGDYLEERVQPILARRGCKLRLAQNLTSGLVALARDRLSCLLVDVEDDASLFTHIIDETVLFEMQMDNALQFSSCGCLDLIADNVDYRGMWLQAERDANTMRAEQILAEGVTAWEDRYEQTSSDDKLVDQYKAPACVDEFILLVQLITERYRFVKSREARLLLCQLQRDLLDDFRVRLLQIYRKLESAWTTHYVAVMNAVAYVKAVLDDWSFQPFFVHLQSQMHKPTAVNPESTAGVFDGISELYQGLWNQMCGSLVESVIEGDCAAVLHQYAKWPWYKVGNATELRNLTNVSAAFCPLLLQLRSRLSDLQRLASINSYPVIANRITSALAVYLKKKLVSQTSFSQLGASQMLYDVVHALIPLLHSYQCCDPDRLDVEMGELVESLNLLSLPVATVILIRDTLKHDGQANIGNQFELQHLDNDAVMRLLAQRQDTPT